MTTKKSLLYIVNFYGTPPLNYFEKYLTENNLAKLTILKLPAVRSKKKRLSIDAFIKDEYGKTYDIKVDVFFPFPYFFVFFFQYLLNFFIAFILLLRIDRKIFDVIIGETNFGGALAFICRKLKKGRYSIYFNGDILPRSESSVQCFFLPNMHSYFQRIFKLIDTFILNMQFFLRRLAYKNDLVWYGNKTIKEWDGHQTFTTSRFMIHDPIKIDLSTFNRWKGIKKELYNLCYIGRIDDYVGLDIIIPALVLLRKDFPKIKLHIIGGSPTTFEKYKHLATQKRVDKHVIFHGYVPHMEDAQRIMSSCTLGMALYKPVSDNVSMVAQPAKPKDYIQVGIPVLVTHGGPEIGDEIVKNDAGIYAYFNERSVYKAISSLLNNKKRFSALQLGVEKYAMKNDYKKSFHRIWSDIEQRA